MNQTICAQKAPYAMELEPGDYYWCACGRSKNQPYCDGSHAGSGLEPMKFTVTSKETRYLCGCKSSGNKPFCDGAHQEL
jgi:CDGSH-type Zn-finger protein